MMLSSSVIDRVCGYRRKPRRNSSPSKHLTYGGLDGELLWRRVRDPEEAARGDIPRQFVTVVGTQIEGDVATVWLLTNDRPPFQDYEVHCVRERGRWHADSGSPFNVGAPDDVLERARGMGWAPIHTCTSAARLA